MRTYEYQISERSILKRGTPFRATQGPYYVTEDGEQISMAGRGPFVFMWAETVKDCDYIHALDKMDSTKYSMSLALGLHPSREW